MSTTFSDEIDYIASSMEEFNTFVNYLADEYLDEEYRTVNNPVMNLNELAATFELSVEHTFTNWYQLDPSKGGMVSGLKLLSKNHRRRLATIFLLEELWDVDAEPSAELMQRADEGSPLSDEDVNALYREFDDLESIN